MTQQAAEHTSSAALLLLRHRRSHRAWMGAVWKRLRAMCSVNECQRIRVPRFTAEVLPVGCVVELVTFDSFCAIT